jgi:uncharacterized iron-regulated membrane protein
MKPFRAVIFWLHLGAGIAAGLVILVMSATGAILAFKPQIVNRIDRSVRFVAPAATPRLAASQLVAAARSVNPEGSPASLTLDRDPSAAAAVGFGRESTVYVNPYSGQALGAGSQAVQRFFRVVENWHRWLAIEGENRAFARSITGLSNLLFLGLAISGLFLWWPHTWLPQHARAILLFRRTRTGRARDFNWHNVIGFWCAPFIIIMTVTGVVMSYPWANRALYTLAGSPVPAGRGGPGPGPQAERAARRPQGDAAARAGEGSVRGERGDRQRGEARPPAPSFEQVDALLARVDQQMPEWRTLTMRLPDGGRGPVSVTLTDARSWNAFARSQLSLDAATGNVVSWVPYETVSRGQRWRTWVRFGHTGELGGVVGQTLAGAGSLGGVLLVWTGLSLAVRRLAAWIGRRRQPAIASLQRKTA